MSTISEAASAVWAAVEAIEALTDEDLRSPGVEAVAVQLWATADELEGRIEAATPQVAA